MSDAPMTGRARPIIMQAESVAGILAGTKTQTRRLVAPQPKRVHALAVAADGRAYIETERLFRGREAIAMGRTYCPYGAAGDLLWVREAWAWSGDRAVPESERVLHGECWYRADGVHINPNIRWRSPIHMPRWAARIWLAITEVRVQRLQEISEEDARAEGVTPALDLMVALKNRLGQRDEPATTYRTGFASLWNEINGRRAPWESNPWVFALTFRRVEQERAV